MSSSRDSVSTMEQLLGDTPQTCIALHALRSERCVARSKDVAIVVEPFVTRGELLGFGDPAAVAHIASEWPGWRYLEVSPQLSDPVAAGLQRTFAAKIERVLDLYFTVTREPPRIAHSFVRLLGSADASQYASSGVSYAGDPDLAYASVIEGPVVAAFDESGRIVASAEANVRTHRYANLSVSTFRECRGRGLCTAVASLACRIVREMGLVPLWSCAENNLPSRRVAEKLGFESVGHCVYLKRPA